MHARRRDKIFVKGDAPVGQRVAVAGQPLLAGKSFERADQQRDAPPAVAEQMAGGSMRGAGVIYSDITDMLKVAGAAKRDKRHAAGREAAQQWLAGAVVGAAHDDAIHEAAACDLWQGKLLVVAAAEQEQAEQVAALVAGLGD